MEIVSRRGMDAPPPPTPEEDNPMTLQDAVSTVNTVLATQYRAFDRLRAVLVMVQKAAAEQQDVEKLIYDLGEEAKQLDKDVDVARQQLVQTQSLANAAKLSFESQLQSQNEQLRQRASEAERNLIDNLASIKVDTESQLASDTAEAKTKLASLRSSVKSAQAKLDSLTADLQTKTAGLTAVQAKLAAARQALDTLKANL